jgi:hypothetical protein
MTQTAIRVLLDVQLRRKEKFFFFFLLLNFMQKSSMYNKEFFITLKSILEEPKKFF